MTLGDPRRAIAVAAIAAILAMGLAALAPQVQGGAVALAADPTASVGATAAATAADRGDLRSPGEGAGFVGAPVLAIGAVLLIGLASAGAAVVYVRLTRDRAGTAGR